jgi:hypothetical protein
VRLRVIAFAIVSCVGVWTMHMLLCAIWDVCVTNHARRDDDLLMA